MFDEESPLISVDTCAVSYGTLPLETLKSKSNNAAPLDKSLYALFPSASWSLKKKFPNTARLMSIFEPKT